MTKFKKYEPQPRDFFRSTDPNIFKPLFPYIKGKSYFEPCWGEGDLEDGFKGIAECKWRSDIEPQSSDVLQKNAMFLTEEDVKECDYGITNPPFSFSMLQPLLEHLPTLKPTWLLLPADFSHNRQSRPYMDRCSHIVSVGRLYFHKGGEDKSEVKYSRGTANNCWYLFHDKTQDHTKFIGWTEK